MLVSWQLTQLSLPPVYAFDFPWADFTGPGLARETLRPYLVRDYLLALSGGYRDTEQPDHCLRYLLE